MVKTAKKDILIWFLFLIILINGFESGGYQASLWEIGQEYNLTKTSMGLYAAMELTATMLAPILLGKWADHVGKQNSIAILLGTQAAGAVLVSFLSSNTAFLVSIFIVGLTTSALQFIAIAAVGDCFPVTGERKIGYITSLYALGAFAAPLCVRWYLKFGVSWRLLFVMIALGSFIALTGIMNSSFEVHEIRDDTAWKTMAAIDPAMDGSSETAWNTESAVGAKTSPTPDQNRVQESEKQPDPGETRGEKLHVAGNSGRSYAIIGVAMLCVIMCIYVGFENGFSFFVDSYMQDALHVSAGKIAISIFWVVMIPARILVGHYARYAKKILLGSCIAIPVLTILIAYAASPALILALCIPLGAASGAIYPCVLNTSFKYSGVNTATVTGAITSATGLGAVIFTTLTGVFSDAFGIRIAIAALAGCFVFSLLALWKLERMDR